MKSKRKAGAARKSAPASKGKRPSIATASAQAQHAADVAASTCGGKHKVGFSLPGCPHQRLHPAAAAVAKAQAAQAPAPAPVATVATFKLPATPKPLQSAPPVLNALSGVPDIQHTPTGSRAYLEGPILAVGQMLLDRLAAFQHKLAQHANVAKDKAPDASEYPELDAGYGEPFRDVFLKGRVLSDIEKFATEFGKSFKQDAADRMEIAGLTGEDCLGVTVAFMKLLHKSGKSADIIDPALLNLAMMEHGIPTETITAVIAESTKPGTPYTYIMPIDCAPKPKKVDKEGA